ncbi:MAG TPA: carboxypeptidase-like regulatory domain-containing protein [Verrucomicrobiales bacterium]|nr:carboxypeptidase-like regulatory domain-containing protein [Verrucomicrobiales bacterium]
MTNASSGAIELTVTNLNNPGQTVIVEKYFDANANGAINTGDLLVQRFKVTDGQVASIGGQRNLNVPGDEDRTANSSILTRLYLGPDEIVGRIDGLYIFRVSPDGAGFSPFTANFTVTQADHGGSGVSGKVMGSGVAQAGAVVLMTLPDDSDFNVVGITMTNASGNYSLKMPAKTYRPVAMKSGFLFNTSTGPSVTVSAGSVASSPDAVLTASSRTIAGAVRDDAVPHNALPGVAIFAQSESGMVSLAFSDASGNYVLDAATGETGIEVVQELLPALGMVAAEGFQESSAGSVTGFNLDLLKATALIYGTVRTPAGVAVPFINVEGETNGEPEMESAGIPDAAGDYALAVRPGVWWVHAVSPGYLASGQYVTVSTAGSAVEHNLTARPVTAHLRGQIKDNHDNPVGNIEILAQDFAGASTYGLADPNGNFDLGVYGGPGGTSKAWTVQLSQGDSDDPVGFISTQPQFQVVDGTDINNINYLAYAVTAHLRGHVLDESNAPLGGISIFANGQTGNVLSGVNTENDGGFDIPVFGNTWKLGLSNITGMGLLPQEMTLNAADNVDQNGIVFRARHTTGTFSGTVKNSQGTGLSGIEVSATVSVSGAVFVSAATTVAGGVYSLPAFSGTWAINANGQHLQSQGYQPTTVQNVLINSGNVTVNFVATTGGQTFASWKTAKFTPSEAADPAQSGPLADFDHDGIVNLMEYALNLEPKFRDTGGLPVPGTLAGGPGGQPWATLTFRRLTGQSGLAYNVQESSGLFQPWTNVTASYEVLSSDGTVDTVRAKAPAAAGGRNYLRLQVVQSP